MREMFRSASAFNQPIGEWDVSSINNFQMTFERAIMFNQNIGDWDVSNVSTIDRMFQNASSFNQPIGEWNTSSVTNMSALFKSASSFNQPLSNWNVSSVTTMWHMFYNAITFDQDLSDWNISNVTNTWAMFFRSLSKTNRGLIHEAFAFNPNWPYDWHEFVALDDSNFQTAVNLWFDNQAEANATYGHISDWNTSAVTDMSEVFKDRANFNEDIGEWDVSKVTNMERIFYEASSFNQDISNWDISSVMTLNGAFRGADSFNQDIGNWNTSLVTDISYLFAGADSFNQNIGNWDTSSLSAMEKMFWSAKSFNQNVSGWNISKVTLMGQIFADAPALTNLNKGLIHEKFSTNSNWGHDWSAFVPPRNLASLAQLSILENLSIGSFVAEFNATDANDGTITYHFANGENNNSLFTLDTNGTLKTATTFDYESNSTSYTITVLAKDELNAIIERSFTVNVLNVIEDLDHDGIEDAHDPDNDNDGFTDAEEIAYGSDPLDANSTANSTPRDINSTAPLSISENLPIGSVVGQLVAHDPDPISNLTFTLIGGSNDNYLFNIEANGTLKSNVVFDFESNNSYVIRVKVRDQYNAWSKGDFAVNITNDLTDDIFIPVVLTDSNFHSAVNLWFSDESNATATYGHISDWNVSAVTDMQGAFRDRANFNEDISKWDVSKVSVMSQMFRGAMNFNGKIGSWNTSSVTNMGQMFNGASTFNQEIGNWNTGSVDYMGLMFYQATSFNQDLKSWDTSSVTGMNRMFYDASSFNQNIGDWNTTLVTTMSQMFMHATAFNQRY